MTTTPASTSKPSRLACLWRPFAFSVGFLVIVGILYAIGYKPNQTSQIRDDRKDLARMASGRHVVFGSSHGYSIDPESAGFDGVNLSHGGQDIFEMVYMARVVKREAPKLELVIFTLSYFTFALDNAAYLSKGTQSRIGRRIVMYAAFPSFRFVPGDASSYVKGMLSPVITQDHWGSLLWPGEGKKSPQPKGSDRPPAKDNDKKAATEKSLASHAKRRCTQYTKLMRNMTSNHPGLAQDAYETLRSVSKDLEKAGVRVVLLTPPYYETYNACFDEKRQALTRRTGKRIASETGAEYIDAGEHPEFSSTRDYFRNSDHMNADGKVAFSRWLRQRLARAEN